MFSVCLAEIVKLPKKFTGKLKYSTCYRPFLFVLFSEHYKINRNILKIITKILA